MANILGTQFIIFIILSSVVMISVTGENYDDRRTTIDPKINGLKKEKQSHLRLYWHDIVSGANPTSIPIVKSPSKTSLTGFGFVNMIDNPLTEGPEMSSKMVGKAQGFYASAAQEVFGLLMAMNFAFIEGKYNGSTLTVLGRNEVLTEVREMPVIGGSGLFRFARGYVQARTYKLNLITGDATVEYDVFVFHY